MNPRKPTEEEKRQLLEWLNTEGYDLSEDQFRDGYIYLTVFENYQTDYPGYQGKVLIILPTSDLEPSIIEIYIWVEGKITRVTNKFGG